MRRSLLFGIALILTTVSLANAAGNNIAIPAGAQISVRVTDKISSGKAQVGQIIHGTLETPLAVNGRVLYPKGAQVTGKVTAVHRSGKLSDPGVLELTLLSVSSGRNSSSLSTQPFKIKGESHAKSNVEKIGGTAAAGTILGAIFGGGKGAAIGAASGAAVGTTVAAATGKKEAVVESEAVLPFVAAGAGNVVVAQSSAQPAPQPQPVPQQMREEDQDTPQAVYRRTDRDDDDDQGEDRREAYRRNDDDHYREADDRPRHFRRRYMEDFGDDDRAVIRSCYREEDSSLPPGLAKRHGDLPPGLERHIQRNGTLPPGLQRRVEPLPGYCLRQLPPPPDGWMAVALGGRILLLDANYRIMDLFYLRGED